MGNPGRQRGRLIPARTGERLPTTGIIHGSASVSGFLGGFTPLSTWMFEAARLGEEGGRSGLAAAAVNVLIMVVVGLIGVGSGVWLAEWAG